MRGFDDYLVLALFRELGPVGDAIDRLRGLGIRDDKIEVLSPIPYPPSTLGRRKPPNRLVEFAAYGAASGFLIGIFLTVGTTNLYPLDQSGQPLVPVPPSIVVIFEYLMLFALAFTFVRFMYESRSPGTWDQIYDPRLTEDAIGILVGVDSRRLDRAERALIDSCAYHLQRLDESGLRFRLRRELAGLRSLGVWTGLVAASLIGIGVLGVFAYGAIQFIYPDQMVTQQSVGYQEGPRLAAPTEAVPIQGPALIDGQPATGQPPPTTASRERGAILYRINCALCHGPEGRGDGPLSAFFSPRPADLLGPVEQTLPPSEIYRVITLGRGIMPSLAENLDAGERWDIIQLIKPAPEPTPTGTP